MQLITSLNQEDFGRHFFTFERDVGSSNWDRVVANVSAEIRGNPFLDEYLRDHFSIAFALKAIADFEREHKHFNFDIRAHPGVYEAAVLVALYSAIKKVVVPQEARALARRVAGGLKNPSDMRALAFELQMLTHFARRGFDIEIPEAGQRVAVDGIVMRDGMSFEIECKSISNDKGRQIHRRDALEIHQLVKRALDGIVDGMKGGLLARLVFNDRPPKTLEDKRQVAQKVKEAVLSNSSLSGHYFDVALREFDFAGTPFENRSQPTRDELREFVARFGVVNREVMVVGRRGVGAFLLSIESKEPDRVLEEAISVAADAAKRQLSGAAPGLVCLKFEGLVADQMHEIGLENGQPTGLRIHASRFLVSRAAEKVTALCFLADGPLRPSDRGLTRSGACYHFVNESNRFASVVIAERMFE